MPLETLGVLLFLVAECCTEGTPDLSTARGLGSVGTAGECVPTVSTLPHARSISVDPFAPAVGTLVFRSHLLFNFGNTAASDPAISSAESTSTSGFPRPIGHCVHMCAGRKDKPCEFQQGSMDYGLSSRDTSLSTDESGVRPQDDCVPETRAWRIHPER